MTAPTVEMFCCTGLFKPVGTRNSFWSSAHATIELHESTWPVVACGEALLPRAVAVGSQVVTDACPGWMGRSPGCW